MKLIGKQHKTAPRRDVPVFLASASQGLTAAQVRERQQKGWNNAPVKAPTRTVGQIICENVCTFFNFIFAALAACLVLVGSFKNMLFLVIAAANTVIGIVQQIRSKRALDRLNLISAPRCLTVREGQVLPVPTAQTVRDEIVELAAGDQITADALVLTGTVQVNESLITGEADAIEKGPEAELLSGSFVVAGRCRARLIRVGPDSYAARLMQEAKKEAPSSQSEMMRSLDKLIHFLGLLLIPVGILLFFKQFYFLDRTFQSAVVSTVAALIGMIPEGLYLLTSAALAVSVLRLAKDQVLVRDLSCVETLARVDVLCVDKTGTITEPQMRVDQVIPLDSEHCPPSQLRVILSAFCRVMDDNNDTAQAMRSAFSGRPGWEASQVLPFQSASKWSAAVFPGHGAYLLGAPDLLLGPGHTQARKAAQSYSAKGFRVLLAAQYDGIPSRAGLHVRAVCPLALILLSNPIRKEAPDTFRYFASQGVAVKVLSGDNPLTVSQVAQQAGIPGAQHYVDASALHTQEELLQAAGRYTVFGRVTPDQKRALIRALQHQGHTVAMTGDGVNDVLALKDADCGIAMASGSDAACHTAQLVLLHSDFSAMPKVVAEGRRVINNIQRAASLFLVKNMFSLSLALLSLLISIPYPFIPIQMSMISGLTIGIPAFFLALEPNVSLVQGKFLPNVLRAALPGALTDLLLLILLELFSFAFSFSDAELSTLATILTAYNGLLILFHVCTPFNRQRGRVWSAMALLTAGAVTIAGPIFSLTPLNLQTAVALLLFLLLALLALPTVRRLLTFLEKNLDKKKL